MIELADFSWPESAAPRKRGRTDSPEIGPKIIDPRYRQTAAQPERRPCQGHQRSIVSAGGMAADKQMGRGRMLREPRHSFAGVRKALREQVLGRQPVADARERDSGLGEARRHERHPLFISVRPAAAVEESKHRPVAFSRVTDKDTLVRIGAVPEFWLRIRCDALHPDDTVGRPAMAVPGADIGRASSLSSGSEH